MRAFPPTNPRYSEVLAARQVPRAPWRNDHTWGRFSRHFCQTYRHRPADSTSLQLCMGKLASKGQTAAQQAQAHGAVDDDAVFLSPEVRSWRDDNTLAPTAPKDGADGLAARKPQTVIGQPRMIAEHAHVLVQANGSGEQTNAVWREAEAQLKDKILRRHYSPKTRQAYAGWMRKFRGVLVKTHPAELTGADAKRCFADLAIRRHVSAAAPHQAFNTLLLLFRQVFTTALGDLSNTPRAKRRQSIPTVLSRQEVERLLAALHEPSA